MSLAERLKAERVEKKPAFEQWLDTLSAADRAALEDAAHDRAWSNAALIRIISDEGYPVGKDSLAKWRHNVTR